MTTNSKPTDRPDDASRAGGVGCLREGWQPIGTRPAEDGWTSFLVLRPGNLIAPALVQQVSEFEGNLYADERNGLIDYRDAIMDASHWMPLPAPPEATP